MYYGHSTYNAPSGRPKACDKYLFGRAKPRSMYGACKHEQMIYSWRIGRNNNSGRGIIFVCTLLLHVYTKTQLRESNDCDVIGYVNK